MILCTKKLLPRRTAAVVPSVSLEALGNSLAHLIHPHNEQDRSDEAEGMVQNIPSRCEEIIDGSSIRGRGCQRRQPPWFSRRQGGRRWRCIAHQADERPSSKQNRTRKPKKGY